MEQTERERINAAWEKEGAIGLLGLRPAADAQVLAAIIPSGGDWTCVARDGDITRRVMWNDIEVALVNPRGDLYDATEGQIAMAFRAAPAMDKAMRAIWILAEDPANCELIRKMARAAIAYVEQPAPPIVEEAEEEERDDDDR